MVDAGTDFLIDDAVDILLDCLYIFMEGFRFDVIDGFDQIDFLGTDDFIYFLVESQDDKSVSIFLHANKLAHKGIDMILKCFRVDDVVDELFVEDLCEERV
jgi:hypothetical protein